MSDAATNRKSVTIALFSGEIDLGVKFYPCEMSMSVMGLKKDDFIEGRHDVIGAVSYLSFAKDSDVNLFI